MSVCGLFIFIQNLKDIQYGDTVDGSTEAKVVTCIWCIIILGDFFIVNSTVSLCQTDLWDMWAVCQDSYAPEKLGRLLSWPSGALDWLCFVGKSQEKLVKCCNALLLLKETTKTVLSWYRTYYMLYGCGKGCRLRSTFPDALLLGYVPPLVLYP